MASPVRSRSPSCSRGLNEMMVKQPAIEPREEAPVRDSSTPKDITVEVRALSGESCSIHTNPFARLADLKVEIHKHLGHSPRCQMLSLGETPLLERERDAIQKHLNLSPCSIQLKDLGISDACVLTLVVDHQPIGQKSLAEPHGKKTDIIPAGCEDDPFPSDRLNKFELKSWRAVCEAHKRHSEDLFLEWNEECWPDAGAYGVNLHWTTRSDGCRYEYWSSAPGDNEYGVLVRIDASSMIAIGMGIDDGLEIFDEFTGSSVVEELILEGWPRPNSWKRASDSDTDDKE